MNNFVEITRTEEFCAAHRLHNKSFTDEENREIFGKCNYSTFHGHNYIIRVSVRGIPDQKTGMVYNICDLKKELKTVLDGMDHKNLDKDVEFFKTHVSTTENLVIYIWNRLKSQMSAPHLLWKIEVQETSKNWFPFYGPQK